jgi:hypothetical protein
MNPDPLPRSKSQSPLRKYHHTDKALVLTQPKLAIMAASANNMALPDPTTIAPDPSGASHPHITTMAMNGENPLLAPSSQPFSLLALPTDILCTIATCLETQELRLLGRVSRSVHHFVNEWLSIYRYRSALFRWPDSIWGKITKRLQTRCDRHRLALASQKFYPAVMKHTVLLDIKDRHNGFLFQAIRRNNMELASKVLRLGADVNGVGGHDADDYSVWSPLDTAVDYGHRAMVLMLLRKGARKDPSSDRSLLREAIRYGREDIALLLWSYIFRHARGYRHWRQKCISEDYSELYLACNAGYVTLARKILERDADIEWCKDRLVGYTHVLLRILQATAQPNKGDSKLPNNVYAMTVLLLEYGADPDLKLDWPDYCYCSWSLYDDIWDEHVPRGTVRFQASRSPDPRIRALLVSAEEAHLVEPEGRQDFSVIIGKRRNICRHDARSLDMVIARSDDDTGPDLQMWDIKKSRIVAQMAEKQYKKIRSHRQSRRTRLAHHQ